MWGKGRVHGKNMWGKGKVHGKGKRGKEGKGVINEHLVMKN